MIPHSNWFDGSRPLLVTGAHGMLGWEWTRKLRALFGSASVLAVDRQELDICDEGALRRYFSTHQPSAVFNCAAYTNVDGAESEREEAWKANALGPKLLAATCQEFDSLLVHYSTDQVFDGDADHPRTEEETPNPSNHYAATKLEGEEAVLSQKISLVLRVQWLYGEQKDRFSGLRKKESFSPFSDQFGAPIWTREIVRYSMELLDKKCRGLYHLAYDDYASWAEIFEFVKQTWHLPVRLEPRRTAEAKLPANRPLFSVMSNAKISKALGVKIGSWKTPFQEFLSVLPPAAN